MSRPVDRVRRAAVRPSSNNMVINDPFATQRSRTVARRAFAGTNVTETFALEALPAVGAKRTVTRTVSRCLRASVRCAAFDNRAVTV